MVLPLVASNLEIFFPPRIEKKVLFVGEERVSQRREEEIEMIVIFVRGH